MSSDNALMARQWPRAAKHIDINGHLLQELAKLSVPPTRARSSSICVCLPLVDDDGPAAPRRSFARRASTSTTEDTFQQLSHVQSRARRASVGGSNRTSPMSASARFDLIDSNRCSLLSPTTTSGGGSRILRPPPASPSSASACSTFRGEGRVPFFSQEKFSASAGLLGRAGRVELKAHTRERASEEEEPFPPVVKALPLSRGVSRSWGTELPAHFHQGAALENEDEEDEQEEAHNLEEERAASPQPREAASTARPASAIIHLSSSATPRRHSGCGTPPLALRPRARGECDAPTVGGKSSPIKAAGSPGRSGGWAPRRVFETSRNMLAAVLLPVRENPKPSPLDPEP